MRRSDWATLSIYAKVAVYSGNPNSISCVRKYVETQTNISPVIYRYVNFVFFVRTKSVKHLLLSGWLWHKVVGIKSAKNNRIILLSGKLPGLKFKVSVGNLWPYICFGSAHSPSTEVWQ